MDIVEYKNKNMTIKKALEHFEWKLSNKWNPTTKDVEAYNEIIQFTEDKLQDQYKDNQLFAKLYITFYGELLKYYNATVLDKEPQKALHKILDTSIESIIHKFLAKANLQEQTVEHSTKNGFKHPKQVDTSDIKPDEVAMTYQEAEDNLTAMINMALTKFK